MQAILSNPIWSTIATVFVALLVYIWKALGTYLEARTPQNIQALMERSIPALVEATEKTKAYTTGAQKLDFVFTQLDNIAKQYGVTFPDAAARAFIEQHVLTLPHTGLGAKYNAVATSIVPTNNTNPVLNTANSAL